jgi:hypothetical protein
MLQQQLQQLTAQERRLEEELRSLAMQHYRALAGRSAAADPAAAALPSSAALEGARASADALCGSAPEDFEALLRRLAHLRAVAASAASGGGAGGGGVGGAPGGAPSAGAAALDLLELPALMESCVRAALAGAGSSGGGGGGSVLSGGALAAGDDALDLAEFACGVVAAQRLLAPAAAVLSREGGAVTVCDGAPAMPAPAAALLLHTVREVGALARELQAGLTHSLASRAPLPVVLKAVALLRRLAQLKAHAVERSCGGSDGGGGGAEAPAPHARVDAPLAARETEAAAGVAAWLRWLFLSERDQLAARELEAIEAGGGGGAAAGASAPPAAAAGGRAPAPPQPPLLRALELHRTLSAELVSQFAAVSTSLTGRGAGVDDATAAAASARALLADALSWRCDAMLAGACVALAALPEAAIAGAQQPLAYSARRSGRFGLDYSGPLGVAWGAQVLDTLSTRLLAARRLFAGADVRDERACGALLSAALKASLDVFNSLRNALPAALRAEVMCELLFHFHALADAPALAEWPSCAGAFSEATTPLLDALERLLPGEEE